MHFLRNGLQNLSLQRTMSFYAVARGHTVGVFDSWSKCEEQVKGYKGARYKKFQNLQEAEGFIKQFAYLNSHKTDSPVRTPAKAYSEQYAPESAAVALGKKVSYTFKWNDVPVPKAQEFTKGSGRDYWSKSIDDAAGQEMSDADLVAAVVAAEKPTTSTLKRKEVPRSATLTAAKMPKHVSKIWKPHSLLRIGDFDFQVDMDRFVIVYTDGSCINNGRENASAGYGVFFGENHPLNAAEPVKGRVTNNVGEIQAAIHAIKVAKERGIKKLCISTDSQFLINAITSWIHGWKRSNWRLKNGEPVKNVADFKELSALLEDNTVAVKWNYVKAHHGISGNEQADKLAREGSTIYKRLNTKEKL